MIIVQDFKTVTFNVLFVYKPTFSVVSAVRASSQFNSLFILLIFTVKPISWVIKGGGGGEEGFIEVKINKHRIW